MISCKLANMPSVAIVRDRNNKILVNCARNIYVGNMILSTKLMKVNVATQKKNKYQLMVKKSFLFPRAMGVLLINH